MVLSLLHGGGGGLSAQLITTHTPSNSEGLEGELAGCRSLETSLPLSSKPHANERANVGPNG